MRSAREGIGADSTDVDYVIRREAQLLINYADSPIVAADTRAARAPDATGLTRDAVTGPLRLFTLFGPGHTLLLYADDTAGPADVEHFERAAEQLRRQSPTVDLNVYLIAAPGADVASTVLPLDPRRGRRNSPLRIRRSAAGAFQLRRQARRLPRIRRRPR